MTHEEIMDVALGEAAKAHFATSPNPMVGAVVVADGTVIATGFHERAGGPHAEIVALNAAGTKARGNDLYVTLEPCVHAGKTPPCVDAILKSGVARVIIAAQDPNPVVNGKGIAALRAAGCEVVVGVRPEESQRLIEFYAKHVVTGMPFVTAKIATSLDGKIATADGESQWITGEESRRYAHELRAMHDVILVGANTVVRDDPQLTTRLDTDSRSPFRVVVDSALRVSPHAAMFQPTPPGALVATTDRSAVARREQFAEAGIEVALFPQDHGMVSLSAVLRELGQRGFVSVLIEGGSALHGAAFDGRLVDKVVVGIAPRIIGGVKATTAIGGRGVEHLVDATLLEGVTVRRCGNDVIVSGYVHHDV